MDQTLFHLINEAWTNPIFDLLMAALSNVDIWKLPLIATVLIAVIFGGFKARACIICILLSLLVAEQFTGLLKSAFDRRRPKQVQSVRMVQLEKTRPMFLTLFKKPTIRYSDESDRNKSGPAFPSGHMANNTAVAVCLTLFYRSRGWLYWILALAIGYSRIYLGAHWPSDVAATVLLAIGETLLVLAGLEWLWRKFAPRFASRIYEHHSGLIIDPGQ
jgi:undecaprenyl-diphosphatase